MTLTIDLFAGDHRDAFQEVVNIGMGSAAAALGEVLDSFVQLSVPAFQLVTSDHSTGLAKAIGLQDEEACAVGQAFLGDLNGEAIVLYGSEGARALLDLLHGPDQPAGQGIDSELLLDVSNILVAACMNGIAGQLRSQIRFARPTILSLGRPVGKLLAHSCFSAGAALVVNITFLLEQRSFRSQILIVMPRDSLRRLYFALDRFLDAI